MLSIIVAVDKNLLIGNQNNIPWHYKEDMQYFKNTTLGKTVVMGSHTYESILSTLHQPLPSRNNIVITSKKDKYPEVKCYSSIEQFTKDYKSRDEEVFIMGGEMIYQQFIDIVDRIYITYINQEFVGDTYFPQFNEEEFNKIRDEKSGDLCFVVYERKVKNNE